MRASYLLGVPRRFELLRWIELGGIVVHPFSSHDLADVVGWTESYTEPGKREMDLADAALYWVARETGVREVMTTDVRGVSRCRLPEVMDSPGLDPQRHRRALRALGRINALSRSAAALWSEIEPLARQRGGRLRVVDLACGGGDNALALSRMAQRRGQSSLVSGFSGGV